MKLLSGFHNKKTKIVIFCEPKIILLDVIIMPIKIKDDNQQDSRDLVTEHKFRNPGSKSHLAESFTLNDTSSYLGRANRIAF